MSTRIKDAPARSVQDLADRAGRLPTGVDGQNVPRDFRIPGSTIEDVDRAVFKLFESRLRLEVRSSQKSIPVPVVFAGGERVFFVKRNQPPRDRKNMFVLPIVSIRRTGLEQSMEGVISGHGMGQNTGDIVIRRRLSRRDPSYQSLINRMGIRNQDNVASLANRSQADAPQGSLPGRVASRRRPVGRNDGPTLAPDLGNNIFEVITMPFPTFYTALYEVTFWTQYAQHMNSLLERMMTSYDAQGHQFRIDTDKGYWYVAYVDDDLSSEDNFVDYTSDERYVKYKFTLKVPAYLHGNERYGSGVPFRRYLSAPQIAFDVFEGAVPAASTPSGAPVGSGDTRKFILSDAQVLDRRGDLVQDERQTTEEVVVPDLQGRPGSQKLVRVLSRNPRKGETIVSNRTIRQVDEILV